MAHGLETRVPFLDNELADLAMRLPARAKLGNLREVVRIDENELGGKRERYFEKTRDGKLLRRKMISRYVPAQITQRAKQGFSAPDASRFKGESIDYVRRSIFDRKARIYNFLDRASVQDLIKDHLEGQENGRLLIWSLLNLEQVCAEYF
jgi:asparagine synthase (glutamine-hydrolysing)